ncbi:hypothetical protein [Prosthecobacter sp.]|uniref:hypothetical protein n=1 Tax=Prosthecobacter sp. TaxID=1965333 RepID=UPI0037836E61
MKSFHLSVFLITLACLFLAQPTIHAQPKLARNCVDELINWKDPWSLTPAKFREIGAALSNTEGKLQVLTKNDGLMILSASMGGKLTLFEGKLNIISLRATFTNNKATSLTVDMGQLSQPATPSMATRLKAEITKAAGEGTPKPGPAGSKESIEWKGPNYVVQMEERIDYKKDRTGVYIVDFSRL